MKTTVATKVLIIGSGIGGLSTAIILAKLGYDVTVVEKNHLPGGMIRSYVREDVHCNVGLHYLGALDEGQVLRRCFDYLGISSELSLHRMGLDGPVDRYLFSDAGRGLDTFDVPTGFTAYEDALRTAFPAEQQQITTLMGMLHRNAEKLDKLDFLYSPEPVKNWIDETEPLGNIFESIKCCPGLRSVFGLPSVLIGVPPAQCPVFYHSMTLAGYLFSSWRLAGNGSQLADTCVRRLKSLGGRVHIGETVSGIRTTGGCVQGVTLESGEQLDAPVVVGAIHPKEIVRLLTQQQIKASYRRRIQSLADTRGMVAVHALVPADKHPFLPHNLYIVQTQTNGDAKDLLYLQLRPSERTGQNLLSLITSGHDSLWSPWQHTLSGRRGREYMNVKTDLAHALLARAEQGIGPLTDVRLLDVSTPLTLRDWVNSPCGSSYGVMRSSRQMLSSAFLNRTALQGLFLAGQNVLSPGVLGTVLGSLVTVQFIVGRERFRKEVRI